jgi:hypothetical protein
MQQAGLEILKSIKMVFKCFTDIPFLTTVALILQVLSGDFTLYLVESRAQW